MAWPSRSKISYSHPWETSRVREQVFPAGSNTFFAEDAPHGPYSAVFEDDGETGYFYALDTTLAEKTTLDAVPIYNAAKVVDRDRPSTLCIVWSEDGSKCALLINGYPQAAFDFAAKRGYCRTNFPNSSHRSERGWLKSDHSWSDEAVAWLGGQSN